MSTVTSRAVVAFILAVSSLSGSATVPSVPSEWTILIFMNGKNSLEQDAIDNFREIASIGSTAQVNVVVEMGRPLSHVTADAGNWSGVLRFLVKKGQEPIPGTAVVDITSDPTLSDMGSHEAIEDFIDWGMRSYPARKYMLVVWNHGQGWRFQQYRGDGISVAAAGRPYVSSTAVKSRKPPGQPNPARLGGFRAVSFDDDTGHYLFNSDIQLAVQKASTRLGRKIDIVGFDACLMSMIETAYAFRDSASFLVASEELEPGPGWDYVPFIRAPVSNPKVSALSLSITIVDGYKRRYGDSHYTTLSVLDLSQAAATATTITALANQLLQKLADESMNIDAVRASMVPYGASDNLKTSIDLWSFVHRFAAATSDKSLIDSATAVENSLARLVIKNYASAISARDMGSHGVAIYFPATKSDFDEDPFHEGYLKSNTDHAVDFVARERWSDFLEKYLH